MMRANANVKTVLTDFLSVPKIIGIGPTMIMPALRILPFFVLLLEKRMIAVAITMIPDTISTKPRL